MLRTLGRSLFVVQHGVHQLGVHNWCLYIYTWFSFELERIQSPGQSVYQRMSAWQRLRMRRPTKRPKTVFWTVHVAMTIALPGLVATAMTLQHMDLIAMQFAEGSVTQIF